MSISTRRHLLSSLGSTAISCAIAKIAPGLRRSAIAAGRLAPPGVHEARGLIEREISRDAATGVAVALVHRGEIKWEEGFGWANRESGLRAAASTPFTLASITKAFTATAVMTLVAEGRVSLDAPANKYLPPDQHLDEEEQHGRATIRFLGAHVSGLPTLYESYDRSASSVQGNSQQLLRTFGRLAYPPNACYEYSNIGFSALAAIASNLAGKSFGDLLEQRVLRPLGLRNSFFGLDTATPFVAARYSDSGNPLPFYTTSTPASGELYASAHDLALFALFNLKGRSQRQHHVLESQWVDELHTPVFAGPSGVASTFGWFRSHLRSGRSVISKIGGQPGVATALYLIPSEELACLVLTNRSNGRDLCNRVCDCILSSYLKDWERPEETCSPRPRPYSPSTALEGRWQGTLKNGDENAQVDLNVDSNGGAAIRIAGQSTVKIDALQAEGTSVIGLMGGRIEQPTSTPTPLMTLRVKLLPAEGGLTGRVLAAQGDPNVSNVVLPYVLKLHRV